MDHKRCEALQRSLYRLDLLQGALGVDLVIFRTLLTGKTDFSK